MLRLTGDSSIADLSLSRPLLAQLIKHRYSMMRNLHVSKRLGYQDPEMDDDCIKIVVYALSPYVYHCTSSPQRRPPYSPRDFIRKDVTEARKWRRGKTSSVKLL